MKVFIENEAGSNIKNLYNEQTLEFQKSIIVARKYPFSYGFVIDVLAEDGDNLDVFILTNQKLKQGQIVECKPIGLMEQFEKSWDEKTPDKEEADHNILAVLLNESPLKLTNELKEQLADFSTNVFENIRKNKVRVGEFLDEKAALAHIEFCKKNIF